MPIVRETDNLEPDSRFDKKPCSIKPRQSGLCRTLTLSIACVLALTRISTLVSVLLTIGWPRTPLFMLVGKHSRR